MKKNTSEENQKKQQYSNSSFRKESSQNVSLPSETMFGNSAIGAALSEGSEQSPFLDGALLQVTSEITGIASPEQYSNQRAQEAISFGLMRDTQMASGQHISLERLQELMSKSTGNPLPMVVAERMEQVLGHDFHSVRIHTDAMAAEAARGISAHAFTSERDIYFNKGMFRPGTKSGDTLIGHELTHVIQHDEGRIRSEGVSDPSDALEREAEKQGHIAAQTLHAPTSNALSETKSNMQELTQSLIRDLVRALDLPAQNVAIHTDDIAKIKTEQASTTGLMENGEVFVHPDAFRPDTTAGKELLAHEMAHIAQQSLSPATDGQSGLLAEAEASRFAAEFVSGAAISPLQYGIPTGHIAADPGDTSFLQKVLSQAEGTRNKSLEKPTTNPTTLPGDKGTENRNKKVRQYRKGVDGIADQIGDLKAFDDLCDAVSSNESVSGPLARVRSSSPYEMLCQMWQGAKDGGEDAPEMKVAFNKEFDDRGFWGSTEKAFDLVCAAAKRDARPSADATKAQKEKEKGEAQEQEGQEQQVQTDDKQGGSQQQPTVELPEGVSPELLNETVEVDAPQIETYEMMSGFPDSSLQDIHEQLNHRQGLSEDLGSFAFDDRASDVFSTLISAGGEGFLTGFKDTLFDTLVLDTAGGLLDKGLSVATKGRFNVPFVGPVISILQTKPWKMGENPGAYFASVSGFDKISSENVTNLFSSETWTSGWEHAKDPGDYIGIFCSKIADFLTGMGDIVQGLQTLAGSLSALAYVVGGILLAVGLALVWLAGVGAPLIAAGGWCTNAGTILSRIATALGGISIGISLLATVFRTAAALLVPTEMYAEQLQGASEAASQFGTQAGNKVGDATCDTIKAEVSSRYQASKRTPEGGEGAGAPKGQETAQKVDQDIQKQETELRNLADKIDNAKTKRDADAENSKEGASTGTKTRITKLGGVVLSRFNAIGNITNGLRDLNNTRKDLVDAFRKPGEAAAQGTPTKTLEYVQEQQRKYDLKVKSELERIQLELQKSPPSPEQRKIIKEKLLGIKARLLEAQMRQRAFEERIMKNKDQHNAREMKLRNEDTTDAETKFKEAEVEKTKLDREAQSKAKERDEATKERIEAEKDSAQMKADHAEAQRQQKEASQKLSEQNRANQNKTAAEQLAVQQQVMKGELETLQNKKKALEEVDQIDKRLKEIEQDPAQQAELEQLQSKRKSLSEEHDFSDASIARQQGKTKRAIKRKHKQLQDLNQKLQLKRSKGQYEGPSREDLLMQKDSAKAQKRELKGKIDSAQGEAEQHRAKENALKEEVSAIGVKQKQNSESLDTERKRIAAQGRKDTTTDNWNMASSGRMTGGTGSAWGGALRSLWDYVSGTGEKEKSPEEQKTLEEEAKAKAKEKFENITKSQKQLENLVDLLPPVSFTELANAKAKAVEAYERYEGFHNDAYKAFIAEQTVVNVSAQTKALAESGKPVQDEITRQGAPLQEAITKTTQRDSVLQQGNTEVGENKEDTGIIALLIEKIASHSDDFNNQPQAGGDGSDAINKGVESSKEQSKQQKEDSLKESEQQRTILDEAITLRATKQQEVDQNITDLNAKHEAEQSILQEIRVEKAQRLSQREAARAEVESHAQTFNVGIQQIQVWSTEYKAKRSETK